MATKARSLTAAQRLADVSLAVLHGRRSRRRRLVVPRASPRSFYRDYASWLRAGGPRASSRRGTCSSCVGTGLRCSSSQLFRFRVVLDLCQLASPRRLRGSLHLRRRRRARLGPSASSGLALTISPNSQSSASIAGLVPASPNKGNTVSRVRTVVLVNTSSTSPRKVAILMPCGTLLFQQTKIPCKARDPYFLGALWDVSILARTPVNPREATNLVSLSATSHIQFVPKGHVFPAQLVPPRRSVQALLACCGCRFRWHAPLRQATNTQVHSPGARDIEYHVFEHQHSLRQDCSRSDHRLLSWCE